MRNFLRALVALLAACCALPAAAQTSTKSPPFEIVKFHVDVELASDGSYIETRELTYRMLTEAAIQEFRQTELSYTEGYQQLDVMAAYTLKANGVRNDVPQDHMLRGYGASTKPGFEDLKTIQIVFPDLEVGDEIVVSTVFRQTKPWFEGHFAEDYVFLPNLVTRDGSVSITAPSSLALQIDNIGLQDGAPESMNGKTRRTWTYHNDTARPEESGAVSPLDTGPRLLVSTFSDQAQIAQLYRGMMRGKADVTPEIKAQADKLISGIPDRREQARAIYEWVSAHIGYVNIVLGAGGFVPHAAPDILQTRYGDCKDHVVLLTALLAAEGIVSQPVLIDAAARYTQPKAASPFVFNHLINYLPEFQLYTDSTARYAPFGTLPGTDADKPVVNIATGAAERTPSSTLLQAKIRTVITATIAREGTADGDSHLTMSGEPSMAFRQSLQLVNGSNEEALFQRVLGPGGAGNLDKGNIDAMTDPYTFSAHFHQENAANMPGPAAISPNIGFRPIEFTPLVGGNLPAKRESPYVCESMLIEEDITLKFPEGILFTSIPQPFDLKADGVTLSQDIERVGPGTLHIVTTLRMDHPHMTCGTDYYARVRPKLAQMITALRGQVIYRLRNEKEK